MALDTPTQAPTIDFRWQTPGEMPAAVPANDIAKPVSAQKPKIDYSWHTFGRWLAMGPSPTKGKEEFRVCRCACGTEAEIHYLALTEGRAKSCGCDNKPAGSGGNDFKDITGQLFGKWLVMRRGENLKNGRASAFYCSCLCGKSERLIPGYNLKGRYSTQCKKCANIKHVAQKWIGGRFNTGAAGVDKHRIALWRMQCICGRNIRNVRGTHLRNGIAKTCGCKLSEPMIGRYFGFWYVISHGGQKGRIKYWECQCVCGFVNNVSQFELTKAEQPSRSCGCQGKIFEIGQVFGRLTVIASKGRGLWLCRCGCPKKASCIIRGSDLRKGDAKSCGCLNPWHSRNKALPQESTPESQDLSLSINA